MKILLCLRICLCAAPLCLCVVSFSQTTVITGRIISSSDQSPVADADIRLVKSKNSTVTNADGNFKISSPVLYDTLVVNRVGFSTVRLPVSSSFMTIVMSSLSDLDVVVVQTGYNSLSKRRSTGSSITVGSDLLSRRVSTNLFERLEGITPGLSINRNVNPGVNQSALSVRGRSTLLANPNPLIVVDNFPYDGDLSNLNPNDVESITVLKDAAAAAIWGAFSGNGVIVVTTKKGRLQQSPVVSITSNITVADKPDQWYTPRLSSPDYVELESFLYSKGYYNTQIASFGRLPLSPVVDILVRKTNNTITSSEADAQLNQLRSHDVRDELNRYFYQPSFNQQYALNVRGGSTHNQYYFSAGYDQNKDNMVGNSRRRMTLTGNNSYFLLHNKLELTTNVVYANTLAQNTNGFIPSLPYLQLADEQGNALPVTTGFNRRYKDTAGQGKLLDWNYRPLDELGLSDNTTRLTDYRINLGLKYKLASGFDLEMRYQFSEGLSVNRDLQSQLTYTTRDLINKYSQINWATGTVTRPIPLGGILNRSDNSYKSNNLRAQLNFNREWGLHGFHALMGLEKRQVKTQTVASRLYGYNSDLETNIPVDYASLFPMYVTSSSTVRIPYGNTSVSTDNRFLSWFTSAAYTYLQRYTISVSLRKDASNLFGVNTNQRGVPLYSTGVNWQIEKEKWFWKKIFSTLTARASYGYNGNIDNTVSAFTTATYNFINTYGQLQGSINSAPNPDIRWERIGIFNIGADFVFTGERLSGSVEYFRKNGQDLIGSSPVAPQSGLTSFKGNTADMVGSGIDVVLNVVPLKGKTRWETNLLFSIARDKVTRYGLRKATVNNYTDAAFFNPLEGKPLYSILSYAWAGLDPLTGDPQGILNGKVSKDYTSILGSTDLESLVYSGPALPTKIASLRNTISRGPLSLSFLITGKFGYYFRRPSIQYSETFSGFAGHPDYASRWQQPGDEKYTQVPSLVYPANGNRDVFYKFSETLVEKGDHIRLQDIQVSYTLTRPRFLPMGSVKIYLYATNIGILWKANHAGLDPDYIPGNATMLNIPPAFSLSGGLTIQF